MENEGRNKFILILVALIILSGGYYLYINNLWPFKGPDSALPASVTDRVYAVSGIAKEVHDSVVVLQMVGRDLNGLTELTAVIDNRTEIFSFTDISANGAVGKKNLQVSDITIGDRLALTSDNDIAAKKNGIFLASSIAVYK